MNHWDRVLALRQRVEGITHTITLLAQQNRYTCAEKIKQLEKERERVLDQADRIRREAAAREAAWYAD